MTGGAETVNAGCDCCDKNDFHKADTLNYRIGNAVCIDEMPDTGRGGQTFAKRTASDASPARAGAASDGILS